MQPLRTLRRLALPALAALFLPACTPLQSDYVGNAQAMSQLAAEPLPAQPWSFAQTGGVVITTPHYRIYTTIEDGLYRRLLAKLLEATYQRAQQTNPTPEFNHPLDCYVFNSRFLWEAYTKVRAGSNAPIYLQIASGGYCQEGVFAGYDIGRDSTLSVIAHEAWHQFSWFSFKDRLPSWLEEGLATQNEAIEWNGVTPTFEPAKNLRRFLALKSAIHENRLWNIDQLLATHAGQVIKLKQEHVDSYYAQLWSIVLFLRNSPQYKDGLAHLLADARAGTLRNSLNNSVPAREIDNFSEHWNTVAGPVYFKKYITADTAKFQREYEAWARDLTRNWPPKTKVE